MPQSQTYVTLRTNRSGMVTSVESQSLNCIKLIKAGRYCQYKAERTSVERSRTATREKQ
jgi:hypothetical protein